MPNAFSIFRNTAISRKIARGGNIAKRHPVPLLPVAVARGKCVLSLPIRLKIRKAKGAMIYLIGRFGLVELATVVVVYILKIRKIWKNMKYKRNIL